MFGFIFGETQNGLPIPGYRFGSEKGPRVLLMGGVHGDEYEGVVAGYGLLKILSHKDFRSQLCIDLVPALNLDGVINKTRVNARGVDLNRNMATKDWSPEIKGPRYIPGPAANSESETRALAKYVEEVQPVLIVSLHSWHPVLNVNGGCLEEAEIISKMTGYKIDTEIGYPTPGCLGTFAGLERKSPTLTYEIERGLSPEEVLKIHPQAVVACLQATEKKLGRKNV